MFVGGSLYTKSPKMVAIDTPLTLDPEIATWVLVPIFVAMFLISLIRHNATKLLRTDAKADLVAIKEAQAVQRSARLRQGAHFLHPAALAARRTYFCEKEVSWEAGQPGHPSRFPRLPRRACSSRRARSCRRSSRCWRTRAR